MPRLGGAILTRWPTVRRRPWATLRTRLTPACVVDTRGRRTALFRPARTSPPRRAHPRCLVAAAAGACRPLNGGLQKGAVPPFPPRLLCAGRLLSLRVRCPLPDPALVRSVAQRVRPTGSHGWRQRRQVQDEAGTQRDQDRQGWKNVAAGCELEGHVHYLHRVQAGTFFCAFLRVVRLVSPAGLGGRPCVCCGTLWAYLCLCAESGSSVPLAVAVTSRPSSMAATLSTVAKSGCQCPLGSPWSFVHSRICVCACTDGFRLCSAIRLCTFAAFCPPLLAVSTCALSDGLVVALAVAWPML